MTSFCQVPFRKNFLRIFAGANSHKMLLQKTRGYVKINMYDYLDCPTIGGGFRLRNDMKSIKNHFPQINLIEIISQILNEYQPNEDYTYEDGQFEYVKDNLINFAKTLN